MCVCMYVIILNSGNHLAICEVSLHDDKLIKCTIHVTMIM